MHVPEIIASLESRAKAVGLSVNEICRRACIARSTFQRWKDGDTLPGLRSLQKVTEALDAAETASEPQEAA